MSLKKQQSKLNLITDTELAKSGTLYVVMDKHRTTCIKQPGLSKPWSTKRIKHAQSVAKETGGVVETLRKATILVASSPCNLPKDHEYYNPDPAATKIPI
jgi:hypothetical protein